MDSNKLDNFNKPKFAPEEINLLTKKDKYNYYLSQVDQNLLEDWKK